MAADPFIGDNPEEAVSLDGGYVLHQKQPETATVGEKDLFYQDISVLTGHDDSYDVVETDRRVGVKDEDRIVDTGPEAIYDEVMSDLEPVASVIMPAIEGYEEAIARAVVESYEKDQALDQVFDSIAEQESDDVATVAADVSRRIGEVVVNDLRQSFGYTPEQVQGLVWTYAKFAVNQQQSSYHDETLFGEKVIEQMQVIESMAEPESETLQRQTERTLIEESENGNPFNPAVLESVKEAVEEYLWQQRRDGIDYRSLLHPEEESDAIDTIADDLGNRGYTEEGAAEAIDIAVRHIPVALVDEE